jgi:hypothetical protein
MTQTSGMLIRVHNIPFSKDELRYETVTQSATGHPLFCPVKGEGSAAIITRLNELVHSKKTAPDCEIYNFIKSNGTLSTLDNRTARALLRRTLIWIPWVFARMKSGCTLRVPRALWPCILTEYQSTPSCSLGDGQAMPSFGTSENK